jgi:TonB family protein
MKPPFALACGLLTLLAPAGPVLAAPPSPALQEIKIVDPTFHTYPESLLRQFPNGGQARVLISVSADGNLTEWLVIAYTARPFGEEAMHAVKSWRYLPARWRGDPISARTEVTVTFETKGTLVSTSAIESLEGLTRSSGGAVYAYRPFTLKELSTAPTVLQAVDPGYPRALLERSVTGEVTVDFYIDEEGTVRMPSLVNPQHPDLASAAIAAIRQWKFSPALANGKPVLVHVQQTFRFNPSVAVVQ